MTTTVYIWNTRAQTGHASLSLSSHYGRHPYLSFHPAKNITEKISVITLVEVLAKSLVGNINSYSSSYGEDVKEHKGYAEATVSLEKLDEQSMALFIEHLLSNKYENSYNLFFRNCSTTVGLCLVKGFSKLAHDYGILEPLRSEFHTGHVSRIFSHYGRDAHSKLSQFIFEELPKDFVLAYTRNRKLDEVASAAFLSFKALHGIIWEPDDVLRVANYIASVENRIE